MWVQDDESLTGIKLMIRPAWRDRNLLYNSQLGEYSLIATKIPKN